MFTRIRFTAPCGCLARLHDDLQRALRSASPTGSFTITVQQGGTVIATKVVTVGPGQDLSDLKAIFQDGTPESF